MIKVLICGASGKMGGFVAAAANEDGNFQITGGIDKVNNGQHFPIYSKFSDIKEKPDVIIDFSHPALLDDLLEYSINNNVPTVIATTGYSDAALNKIKEAAKKIPVFFTFNMSLGVNLICSLAKKAASILGNGFDVEIVEKHHNQKIDAPSGTAIMLADAVNAELNNEYDYRYDRSQVREKRPKKEIGISAVRGGSIVGEHEIIFAGKDEVLEFKHTAYSKAIFAKGAVQAAKFLKGQKAGMYSMKDVLGE